MFISGVQRLESTSIVTAEIKVFACFFQCVMATKSGNHHRKIWTAQKCRGVQKGKMSQAGLCQDVLPALGPHRTVLLPLCPWTTILSPKHNTESTPGQAQLLNVRSSSMGQETFNML